MREADEMNHSSRQFKDDRLREEALERFCKLVESVGVKRFAESLGVGTRQVNRILSGAQPNPIERLVRCLQSAEPEVGDRVLDYICQEMGGHFVRMEALDKNAVNAVRECAEAIAAISDGHVSDLDIKEIRDAISALAALSMSIKSQRRNWGAEPGA
jgi:hypothetical protein